MQCNLLLARLWQQNLLEVPRLRRLESARTILRNPVLRTNAMTYRTTTAASELLADCVRSAFVGWAIKCPIHGATSKRIVRQCTTIRGFQFSKFINQISTELGSDYCPAGFPLNGYEVCALGNDLELQIATPIEVRSAALIVAHSPWSLPSIGSKEWGRYIDAMEALHMCAFGGNRNWDRTVSVDLAAFRRVVAGEAVYA
jgi:hypothetical protein